MKVSECSHLRLRDGNCNDYAMDVEWMIKYIEDVYKIDFRSLPDWKQLIQRLQHANTFCKQTIRDSHRRKAAIIHKLLIQSFRLSPFELTENMVRTAKKWQIIYANLKMKKKLALNLSELTSSSSEENNMYDKFDETMGEESPGRPNTEVIDNTETGVEKEEHIEVIIAETLGHSTLPPNISTNQHKFISLSKVSDTFLKHTAAPKTINIAHEKSPKEWLVLHQNSNIKSVPSMITIQNNSQDQQTISFALVNRATEISYLNLRYKGVTDDTAFRYAKVIPATPVKLFPGVPVHFKFVFKLESDQKDFTCHLYFRVGQKVYAKTPVETFRIPVNSQFKLESSMVHVTEAINIPPMYFWRINAKSGFPFADFKINITGTKCYDLHISKFKVNLAQDPEENVYSFKPTSPTSDTIAQRDDDHEVMAQSQTLASTSELPEETESVLMGNFITLIIDEAIDVALDVFVFEKRFLYLEPNSKQSVRVFHTKAEHVGLHQSLYQLAFTNSLTGELDFSRTIKVFGEVLPNPVQIYPSFLDMTGSPISNGRCEDHFTIVNGHRGIPVTIKIKLTTKMKKMIHINPMETHISTCSSVDIFVSFCSKDLYQTTREDFVHLTFKIIVIGDKSVYRDLPPIFYEMLVPCTSEFKKLYNEKFFNEFFESLCEEEIEPQLPPMPTPSSRSVKRVK